MRLWTWIKLLPFVALAAVLAIANRQEVILNFDPFHQDDPFFAFRMPLFFVIFGSILAGMLIGGAADWLAQGRYRRQARQEHRQVRKLEKEIANRSANQPDAEDIDADGNPLPPISPPPAKGLSGSSPPGQLLPPA